MYGTVKTYIPLMANKPLDISHYVAHYFHCDFGYFFLNSVVKYLDGHMRKVGVSKDNARDLS